MNWDYIVIERPYLLDLVTEVNRRIKAGYRPLGGVSHTVYGYIQAMIKDAGTDKQEEQLLEED